MAHARTLAALLCTALLGPLNASPVAAGNLDVALGKALFDRQWVPAPASTDASDGLGPLFNARSCAGCHPKGGRGQFVETDEGRVSGSGLVLRLGTSTGAADPIYGRQLQTSGVPGQIPEGALMRSKDGQLRPTNFGYGPLHADTRTGGRLAPSLAGAGLLQSLPHSEILAWADPDDINGDGISGRANLLRDRQGNETLGRFGWKAASPNLDAQTATALAMDLGLSNPLHPAAYGDCTASQTACKNARHGSSERFQGLEVTQNMLRLLATYVAALAPPSAPPANPAGLTRFTDTGCAACHRPRFTGPDGSGIRAYSDLLLHDMGTALADGIGEGAASGSEWRTPPLWGLRQATRFLHDGRARTLRQAIEEHGGEATAARLRFLSSSPEDQVALLNFLSAL
jgi:CxxC motif-containing protein (DUF1111 family)